MEHGRHYDNESRYRRARDRATRHWIRTMRGPMRTDKRSRGADTDAGGEVDVCARSGFLKRRVDTSRTRPKDAQKVTTDLPRTPKNTSPTASPTSAMLFRDISSVRSTLPGTLPREATGMSGIAPSSSCSRLRASTEEDVYDLSIFPPFSHIKGGVLIQLAPRIHIGTGGKQDMNDLSAAFDAGYSPVPVENDLKIQNCLVQSGVPMLTAPGYPLTERVHVRTGGEQGLDDFNATFPDGDLKGGISIHPGIGVGARGNQGFDDFDATLPDGNVKGGKYIHPGVGVRARGKQGFDSTTVPTLGRIEQLAVKSAGVVSKTGRGEEDEHENNGDDRLHEVVTPLRTKLSGSRELRDSCESCIRDRDLIEERSRFGALRRPCSRACDWIGNSAHPHAHGFFTPAYFTFSSANFTAAQHLRLKTSRRNPDQDVPFGRPKNRGRQDLVPEIQCQAEER